MKAAHSQPGGKRSRKTLEARLTADLDALTRIHALSAKLVEPEGLEPLLQEIMEAAVAIMAAEQGTLQLLEGNSLRIVASHGHRQPFLEFFASAENRASVCGEAMTCGKRVIVPDVETSSLFIGTPSLAVLREAGVRAVQSTPLISRTGALLGILTTQWTTPHSSDEHDLWSIDLLARQAADLIESKQAESALRKSNSLLARAEQVANMGSWEWDIKSNRITWSEQVHRIFGFSKDQHQLSDEEFYGLIHPEDRSRVRQAVQNSLNGEKVLVEFRITPSESSVRHLLSRGDVDLDHQGKPSRMIGIIMDITERRATEARLAYEASFPQNDPSPIVEADYDGHIRYANPSALRLFPDIQDKGAAHPWLADWETLLHSIREGEAAVSYRDVKVGDRTFHQVIQHRPEEAAVRMYGIEITERKRAEEQVGRSQRTFSDLVERAPFGIYIVDSQFRIAQMNAGSQNGTFRNVRPVIGRDFAEAMRILWPEPVATEIISEFRHTLDTGEPYYSPPFFNPRHDVEAVEGYEWELHRMTLPDRQYGVVCYYFDSTKLRESEEAVRSSEKKYRQLFNSMTEGFLLVEPIFDKSGKPVSYRYLDANPALAKLTHLKPEDIVGKDVREILPAIEPHWIETFARVAVTGKAERLEEFSKDLNGWYDVQIYCPETGKAALIYTNTTERRVAEAERERLLGAVQEERDRLAALIDSITDEVWFADCDGKFTLENPSALNEFALGVSSGTVDVQQLAKALEVYRPDGSLRPAEEAPPLRALKGEILKDLEEIIRTPATGELRHRQVNASPVRDVRGKIIGSVSVVRDITDRKRADEELRQSRERLRQHAELLEHAPVLVRDMQDRITVWTSGMERLYGFTRSEALGQSPHDLLRTMHPCPLREIAALLERDRRWEGELRHRHRDGREVIVKTLQVMHEDDNGRPTAIVEVNSDITQRKRLEEALREADRRKNEFLAMLAHELRNPLAAISSAVELLNLRGSQDPLMVRARDAATRQTAHMAHLLDDLLDVARVTQGKVVLNQEDIPLGSILESAIEASNPIMNARKHQCYVAHPREPMMVHGDRVRLSQVIGNLLHNSAKYTPPGGEIYLTVQREGDQALILVRDNGNGIDPELLPHVFDLFVQGNRSPDRAEGGLGVGLTLVRSIVEIHGGRVEAHSEGPGCGSEFRIWLPLLPSMERRPKDQAVERTGKQPLRILVVDDNADSAELLSVLLEIDGHKVIVANSGPTAIEKALEHLPEVALIDIGMPGMDGYEVARRLRQSPELNYLALVAISGYGQQEDVQRSREAGFDEHLVKPVDMNTLGQVLRKIAKQTG